MMWFSTLQMLRYNEPADFAGNGCPSKLATEKQEFKTCYLALELGRGLEIQSTKHAEIFSTWACHIFGRLQPQNGKTKLAGKETCTHTQVI